MTENTVPADSEMLSKLVVQGMQEKKASGIVVMDLRKIKNAVADFFVIGSGNSDTQVDAISDSVEEFMSKQAGQNPWHREGKNNNQWVLLDYIDVVAHIFQKDTRDFYALETLWGDAVTIRIEDEEVKL